MQRIWEKIQKNRIYLVFVCIVAVIFLAICAVKIYQHVTRETVMIDGKKYYKKDVTTVLFMGIDNRGEIESEIGVPGYNGQADMLALLIVDNREHSVNIVTIPRETMVDVDVYGRNGEFQATRDMQLCLQYAYGTDSKSGCELTIKAVEGLFEGIPIDEYIAISMGAIDEVVEAFGGVTVTMTEDHWIPGYEYQAGDTVKLEGEEAYEFIHFRDTTENGTNLDRMSRQKDFINGLIAQIKASPIKSMTIMEGLYSDLQPYMTTSIEKADVWGWIWRGIWIDADEITLERISGEDIHVDEYDQYLVDLEEMHKLVLENFYTLH